MAEPLMTCHECHLNVGIYDFANHFSKHSDACELSLVAIMAERNKGLEVNDIIEQEAPLDLPHVYQPLPSVPSRMGKEVVNETE